MILIDERYLSKYLYIYNIYRTTGDVTLKNTIMDYRFILEVTFSEHFNKYNDYYDKNIGSPQNNVYVNKAISSIEIMTI